MHVWDGALDAALDVVNHLGGGRVPVDVGVPVNAAPVVGPPPAAAIATVAAPAAPAALGVVVDEEPVAAALLVGPLPLEGAAHGAVLLVALARVRSLHSEYFSINHRSSRKEWAAGCEQW